jgi:hypothetical protein
MFSKKNAIVIGALALLIVLIVLIVEVPLPDVKGMFQSSICATATVATVTGTVTGHWSYYATRPGSWGPAVQELQSKLTQLPANLIVQNSLKIATTDAYTDHANALAFYFLPDDHNTAPPVRPTGKNWVYAAFSNSNYEVLWNQVTAFLNGTEQTPVGGTAPIKISTSQAYYSQISALEAHREDPAVLVWYLADN